MVAQTWPKVVIAGGSIGGLTAGLLLRDLGCEVDIYERSASPLEDRGVGIVVLPVTERYFTESAAPPRVSLELRHWTYVDSGGAVIDCAPVRSRFSAWGTIYGALLEAFGQDRYHLDHEVVGFDDDGRGVTANFANGSSVDSDLLIFADGLSSAGRSILLPDVRPAYSGYVAWRGTTPEAALSGQAQEDLADAMIYQVLAGGHILVYAIPDREGRTDSPHRAMNFVWYRNYPAGGSFEDLMQGRDGRQRTTTMPPGTVRKEHIEEMESTARQTIAPTLLEVILECEEPLIQAVFDYQSPRMALGRVCLIGDAAATLRPHVAAGQAKASADAWALRDALLASRGDIETALAAWEPTQLDLADRAFSRSREMGIASQFDGSMEPGDPSWRFGLWEPGN